MALYGTGGTGIPFTGFTAILSDVPQSGVAGNQAQARNDADALNGTVQKNGLMQQDQNFNRITHGTYNQTLRALLGALNGRTAGAFSASSTKRRVLGSPQASTPDQPGQGGGVVSLETYTMISRPSTATDVADLKSLITFRRFPATYAPDISGNSGGGKLGY